MCIEVLFTMYVSGVLLTNRLLICFRKSFQLGGKLKGNKRAERALGRSPEERSRVTVKPFTEDHLICCPPNIGRGPLDNAIYIPNMKALGLVVSDKIFENSNLKTYFLTP